MPAAEEIVQTDFEVEIQARIDAERARLRAEAGLARMREFKKPVERTFTAKERDYVTILFGGLTRISLRKYPNPCCRRFSGRQGVRQ
jgi:hypothetical protein